MKRVALALALLTIAVAPAWAQDSPCQEAAAKAQEITELVEQLGSEQSCEANAAFQALARMGCSALPAIEAAAKESDSEQVRMYAQKLVSMASSSSSSSAPGACTDGAADEMKEKISQLRAQIERNPADVDARVMLAGLFVQTGNLCEARSAVDVESSDPRIHLTRGAIHYREQDFAGAVRCFDRAIALDGENVDGYHHRAYARMALRDLPGAIADVDKMIEIAPENPNHYVSRGRLRVHTADLDGATADLEKALTLDPKSGVAHVSLGVVDARRGQYESALEHFATGVALDSRMKGEVYKVYAQAAKNSQFAYEHADFVKGLADLLR